MRFSSISKVAASFVALAPHLEPHTPTKRSGADPVISNDLSIFIQSAMAQANATGLSLGIVRSDGELEFGGWGNSTEGGDPVKPDTLFNIGSCTKAFTAASLGILMEDYATGKNKKPLPSGLTAFDYSTKMAQLLPNDWRLMDEFASAKSSLHDLLSHITGIPRHDFSYFPNETSENMVRNLQNLQTPLEFREEFSYNNQMYMTGAFLLTTLSGQSYSEFAKNRIFDPLVMNDTMMSPSQAQTTGRLSQSFDQNGRRVPYWINEESIPLISGAGGIISSAKDMTKWLQTLLNGGVDPVSNRTIIPASAFATITAAKSILNEDPSGDVMSVVTYGMGWFRLTYRGHDVVAHDGSIPGYNSFTAFMPTTKLGIVILTNSDGGGLIAMDVLLRTIDSALGLEPLNITNPSSSSNSSRLAEPTRAVDITVPSSVSDYAGTYSNPGYGSVTLCPFTNSSTNESSECKSIIEEFSRVPGFIGSPSTPQLFASFPRIWSAQLHLESIGGDNFTVEATTLFPSGFGADTSPFAYTIGDVLATFERGGKGNSVSGFFVCGISSAPDELGDACLTGNVDKTGLVWFQKE